MACNPESEILASVDAEKVSASDYTWYDDVTGRIPVSKVLRLHAAMLQPALFHLRQCRI